MAEFIADAGQTVAVNGNVLFTDTPIEPCPCVRHRKGSGIFTLRGGHRYLLMFNANLVGATADTQVDLAFTIAGETVPGTVMASTPSVADAANNVSASVYIDVPPCCCYSVGIRNVDNANLIIIRES